MTNEHLTEEQRAEMFRQFHSEHLQRQTRKLEQIHTYVAGWFWLSLLGAFALFLGALAAGSSGF